MPCRFERSEESALICLGPELQILRFAQNDRPGIGDGTTCPYRLRNSRSLRVWARETGISVCLRSCILS